MPINIIFPEGNGYKTGFGTKAFTDDGVEITGIERMTIEVASEEMLIATIRVAVDKIKNAEGIVALLPPGEAKKVMEWARQSSTATEG